MPYTGQLPPEGQKPWYATFKSAWDSLVAFVDGLETSISTIELTPGPQGDPGPKGDPGDDGAPGTPASMLGAVGYVSVVTGLEARPTGFNCVIWVDSRGEEAAPPLNLGASDVLIIASSVAPTSPTIVTTELNALTQGEEFSQTLSVTGTAPFSFSAGVGLPAGLTLASNGTVSGTPSGSGPYSFVATVTNPAGSDTHTFSGTVASAASTAWVQRSVVQSPRNGGALHNVAFNAASAGNLLVAIAYGPVTLTTPSGWTLRDSEVSDGGLYVWTKTATGGEATIATTANASNAPIVVAVYELAAGAAWVGSIADAPITAAGANPSLAGLTGTNLVFAVKAGAVGGGSTYTSTAWTGAGTPVEDVDLSVAQGATDGYGFSIAYVEDYAGTSWAPTGTVTADFNRFEAMTLAISG